MHMHTSDDIRLLYHEYGEYGNRSNGKGQGARGKGQGARGKGQGARGKGQGARGKGQGARGKVTGSSHVDIPREEKAAMFCVFSCMLITVRTRYGRRHTCSKGSARAARGVHMQQGECTCSKECGDILHRCDVKF
jgi:hypothetical protein